MSGRAFQRFFLTIAVVRNVQLCMTGSSMANGCDMNGSHVTDVTTCDVTSNPVAILLPVMRNDTFYTNTIVRTKRGENDVTSGHVTSVHVTSISHATIGTAQGISRGEQRGACNCVCVTGSDVTGIGPYRK
jgi:hypothetical protein